MESLWLLVGLLLVSAWFIAHARIVSIRGDLLKNLKKNEIEFYRVVLGDRQESWLERGWYSPFDFSIVQRLHRAIKDRELPCSVQGDMLDRYVKARKIRFCSGVGFFCVYFPITLVLALTG